MSDVFTQPKPIAPKKQPPSTGAISEQTAASYTDEMRNVQIQHLLVGFWAGRWIVAAAITVCLLIGIAYAVWIATPKYQTQAQIALVVRNQQVVDLESVVSGISTDRSAINTELEVIKSRTLLEQLSARLALTEDPEFIAAAGDALTQEKRQIAVLDALRTAISVSSLRDTFLITIQATTNDPDKSALIANTLAQLYLEDQVQSKFAATEYAVDWLSERVSELEFELNAKEDAIKDLREETALISLEALEALNIRAKDIRERLAEARAAVFAAQNAEQDAAFERRKLRLASLEASYASLQEEIDAQNKDLVTLNKLRREADATRVLYETFLSRLKETTVQIGLNQADGRILSAALPGKKVAPNEPLIFALSALLGLLFGVIAIILRSMMRDGFYNADELEHATGINVIGQLPVLPLAQKRNLIEHLKDKPNSYAAEAIRNLRTAVLMSNPDNPPQVIQSTSSIPGEGKTTLAIGLAMNLVALDSKVILIECDIRRQTFGDYFDTQENNGLVSVISGDVPLSDAVFHLEDTRLDVLAGDKTHLNAADIFSSNKFKELLAQLREEYDFVIIDTPPINAVTDARIIAQQVDALVYSVRAEKTSKAEVLAGLRELEIVNIPVAGLVLSQVDPSRAYRSGYGRRKRKQRQVLAYYQS